MKILHVDPEIRFGGGERQVLGLLRHLARRGHENVLAADPRGRLADLLAGEDARLVPLVVRNDMDFFAAFRLRRLVARESPHLVHFHTSRAHALAPWVRRPGVRAVVTRRMDYPIRRGRWSDRLYNRSVDAVAAISEEVSRQLVSGGVRPERVCVIHSAVEPPAGLPGPAGRDAARRRFGIGAATGIGVVAALERRKGHDVLLRALARFSATDPAGKPRPFVCLLCGGGSERNALERLASTLGLGDSVRFLGEQRQVADVLAALDLFVLPSRYEGLGVAVLEAMAVALPVVASAVGGIPEAVVDGVTGLLVPAEDEERLAAAIAALADEPERAAAMGWRGRERILERFSMERMAAAYERLYAQVAAASAENVD